MYKCAFNNINTHYIYTQCTGTRVSGADWSREPSVRNIHLNSALKIISHQDGSPFRSAQTMTAAFCDCGSC